MKNKKSDKKPRTLYLTMESDSPKKVNGFYFGPISGTAKLLYNGTEVEPTRAFIETTYQRTKSPKVLNRMYVQPKNLIANVDGALINYKTVIAVDTNTRNIDFSNVSVTAVVIGQATKIEVRGNKAIGFGAQLCLEYHNVKEKPENHGWHQVIKILKRSPWFNNKNRIALLVDSDLGNLDSYNARLKPYYEDIYLPKNITFTYASSDASNDGLANKMISLCDKEANGVLRRIESRKVDSELVETIGKSYSHFRMWTRKKDKPT